MPQGIRLRPGKDLSIGDKLEVWTRQSAFQLRDTLPSRRCHVSRWRWARVL